LHNRQNQAIPTLRFLLVATDGNRHDSGSRFR
jgi:hypothetical protein